ncbi:MAG: serine/threonine-protein kinase [Myxococcota bacterium]
MTEPEQPSLGEPVGAVRESLIDRFEDELVRKFAGASSGPGPAALEQTAAPEGGQPRLDFMRGEALGRYLLLDRLGAGAMGEVFSAYDPELDRKVAVKLLRTGGGDPAARRRLLREAQAMAKLNHANVVTVHDVGTANDRVYIAMELVDGQTLSQWLSDAKHTQAEALEVLVAAGRGLAAAHAKRLVHRDFKPDNVMVGRDGRVLVTDFGLVHSEHADADAPDLELEPSLTTMDSSVTPLTNSGTVVGTPRYMAPEQWAGLATDGRTDQFAFCVVLYQALCGTWPFVGDSVPVLMRNVTEHNLVALPPRTRIPIAVRRAILRGLSLRRDDRWPTMERLLLELSRDRQARRRRWITGVAVAASGAGLAVVAMRTVDREPLPCAEAGQPVREQWSPVSRRRVAEALLATGAPYAEDTVATVHQRLDDYVDRLESAYAQACRDTHVLGRQSEAAIDTASSCNRSSGSRGRAWRWATPSAGWSTPSGHCRSPRPRRRARVRAARRTSCWRRHGGPPVFASRAARPSMLRSGCGPKQTRPKRPTSSSPTRGSRTRLPVVEGAGVSTRCTLSA